MAAPRLPVPVQQRRGPGKCRFLAPLAEQRLCRKLLVEPKARLPDVQQRQKLVMTPRLEQAGQREGGRRDMREPRVVRPGFTDQVEVAVGVQAHERREGRDLAEAVGNRGEVVDAVIEDRLAQPFEPLRPRGLVRWRVDQDRHQVLERPAHRTAEGAGGRVDVLEGGPDAFRQHDHALGGGQRIGPVHRPDLRTGQVQPVDGLGRSAPAPGAHPGSGILTHVDGYLCEIKDLPIRGGLHILGETPEGEPLRHLLASILRLGAGEVPGLRHAAGAAFGLDERDLAENGGTKVEAPPGLVERFPGTVVTASDLLDRLEEAQQSLLRGMEERGWDAERRRRGVPGDAGLR